MSLKPMIGIRSATTDAELAFIRQMGIEYVEINVKEEETTPEALKAFADRLARSEEHTSDSSHE